MDRSAKFTGMDIKVKLSTLWLFATLNYLYCDVVTVMDPQKLKQFVAGTVGGMQITQGFLLGAGILVEIPIAMVLISRVLKYRLKSLDKHPGRNNYDSRSSLVITSVIPNTLLYLL